MMPSDIYNNDPLALNVVVVTHGSHTLIIRAHIALLAYEIFNIKVSVELD